MEDEELPQIGLIFALVLGAIAWLIPIDQGEIHPSFDDREAIAGNPVVEGSLPITAAFDRDYWHHLSPAGHYRPLATVSLRVDRALSSRPDDDPDGIDTAWFRRTNVLMHVAVLGLIMTALVRARERRGTPLPWFGLALVACHPALADVVAWISGRTSLVSGLGLGIGASIITLAYRSGDAVMNGRLAVAGGFLGTGFALLGKEDGVVLLLVLPSLAMWFGGKRPGALAFLGAAAATALVAAARASALGSAMPHAPGAPLAGTPILERIPLGLAAWWDGIARVLAPWVERPPSITVDDLREEPGVGLRATLTVAATVGAAVLLALRSKHANEREARDLARAGLFSLGLAAAATAPLLQIIPAGELFAPRFLYLPLLLGIYAWSGLVDALLAPIPSRAASLTLCVALLVFWCSLSTEASAPYASRRAFWESHLPHHAGDPQVWNALGNGAREEGDRRAAEQSFKRAIELDPTYSRPYTNLGTLALEADDLLGAEAWLLAAVEAGPSNPQAHANLGNCRLRMKAFEAAGASYERATQLAPGRGALFRGLARARLGQADVSGARAALEEALRLDPSDGRSRRLLEEIEAPPDVPR